MNSESKTRAALIAELNVLHKANRIYWSKGASVTANDRAQHQLRQDRLKVIRAELNNIAAPHNEEKDVANCERLLTCPFFTGALKMPSVETLMKATYCLGDKTQCARYQLVIAGIPVPTDLLPNDEERAKHLLASRAIKRERRSF
jgi:hypothetical protein